MLEVRLNLAFLRMTMKQVRNLVKGAPLPLDRPVARPVATTTTPCTAAYFWANVAESGWDSMHCA